MEYVKVDFKDTVVVVDDSDVFDHCTFTDVLMVWNTKIQADKSALNVVFKGCTYKKTLLPSGSYITGDEDVDLVD